jgi:hypothetical protein
MKEIKKLDDILQTKDQESGLVFTKYLTLIL